LETKRKSRRIEMSGKPEKVEKEKREMGTLRKMAISAEKKMAGKLATKSTVRSVALDDETEELLDSIYRFAAEESNKESAQSLRKDMIKIVVKVGVLIKNEILSAEEMEVLRTLRRKLVTVVNMMITFEETAFTYDAEFLQSSLLESRDLCNQIVAKHLTEKSVGRSNHVFNYLADPEVTRKLFCDPKFKPYLTKIVEALKVALDHKVL